MTKTRRKEIFFWVRLAVGFLLIIGGFYTVFKPPAEPGSTTVELFDMKITAGDSVFFILLGLLITFGWEFLSHWLEQRKNRGKQ